jgi:phage/plasmid-associated DNA primase
LIVLGPYLVPTHSTVDQAAIIAKHLEYKCFLTRGEILYELTEFNSYEKTTGLQIQNKLLIIVAKLISESYNKLTDVEKTELSSMKKWSAIWSNAHIKTYYPQLVGALTKTQVMDDYSDEIHFQNGYFDLADGKFKQREHFITYFIDYDYEAPTKKQLAAMRKIVRKTFPLVEDYDCMCTILGSALTGRATLDQTILFLLGDASSGKSNVLSSTELSVQKYFVQLKDDLFAAGTTTADKVFNIFRCTVYSPCMDQ